jgi:RNase H-fold protein (predicted Holliday junction resolvase)
MDITHGKYLGVDYGDKRTGLAECDLSGMLASGICTISEGGMSNTAVRVAKEAESRCCKKIIIQNFTTNITPYAKVVVLNHLQLCQRRG